MGRSHGKVQGVRACDLKGLRGLSSKGSELWVGVCHRK
jgi:hypothetical protein